MKQRSKESAEIAEISDKISRLEALLLRLPAAAAAGLSAPAAPRALPANPSHRPPQPLPTLAGCSLGTAFFRLLGVLIFLRLVDLCLAWSGWGGGGHKGSVILGALSQQVQRLGVRERLESAVSAVRGGLVGGAPGGGGEGGGGGGGGGSSEGGPAPGGGAALQGPFWRGPAIEVQGMQYGTELGDADYDGYFEKVLFKDTHGAYPLMIVADIFFHCPTSAVHIISRHYKRSPQAQNFSEMRVALVDEEWGVPSLPLISEGWHVETNYETSAVGIFPYPQARDKGGLCDPNPATRAGHVKVHVQFREASKTFTLAAPVPQPPPVRFSAVAVFSFNNYMLKLWVDYWSLLGIETFYLFYNGPESDIPHLNASLSDLRAHVVWVEWPLLHWIITDATDITHGQPMAIVSALQRWRESTEYLFFYDLDEYLVLPRHTGLAHFMDEYNALDHGRGPLVALRTQCSWALFNLSLAPPGVTIADLNVSDFAVYPIVHGDPGGREKYWMNASARRVEHSGWGSDEFRMWMGGPVHNINLHGIYAVQDKDLAHVRILDWGAGAFPAYHIHLLNTRTPERTQDGRDIYFVNSKNKRVDTDIGDMVRRLAVNRRDRRRRKGGK